ncbi:MAG: hypothetical protein LBH26_05580 [Treponema sp.]|jgi:hypothetical protein|nr:hypothetical protein [Treponema sp.]
MNSRENYLRTVRFEHPDYIPMTFALNPACWAEYDRNALFDLLESHPFLFPGYRRQEERRPSFPLTARRDEPFLDDFGCLWKTARDGLVGTVVGHPLKEWGSFEAWKAEAPNPETCSGIGPLDWARVKADTEAQRGRGEPAFGELRHGHTFLQLCDIRSYENLICDFADDEPRLWELIAVVEGFNRAIVERYLETGVDVMGYPDDLGMQRGPMLSPGDFRKYIKPSYQRLMEPARNRGIPVHMHSDGDIRDLLEDLLDCGTDIINLQDMVNGLDFIAERLAGKTCVELDIDRQSVTVFGTPADIDRHIRGAIASLGRKEGGLMLIYGWYPGTPIGNAAAVMDAMERYRCYFNG